MTTICRHIYVSGRVQGVWFRAFVRDQAEKADVQGWAKNLPDGRVEALLCGDKNSVLKVEAALHQGPRLARVDKLAGDDQPLTDIHGFEIL